MAKRKVVGLDIGTTAVRAAVVSYGNSGPTGTGELHNYGQVPLPPDAVRDGEVIEADTVATAIKRLWSEAKISLKDVAIGVGNQRVIVRDLTVPWMPMPQLRKALPYQVQELLPMSTDDAMLDFYPTGEGNDSSGRTVNGLFVGAVKETVSANLQAVLSAGLNPVHVDLNGFAFLRALNNGSYTGSTVAFVDIGARITNVVIAQQGIPRFIRVLPNGGQDVTDAVAGAMSLSGQEAEQLKREVGVGYTMPPERQAAAQAIAHVTRSLIDSIRNTFTYFTQANAGAVIDGVLVTGGGALLPGFTQYLSSVSRLPVYLANPLDNLDLSKSARANIAAGHEGIATLAIGLGSAVVA